MEQGEGNSQGEQQGVMEQGEGNSQGGQQGVMEHHHLVENSQPTQAAIAADGFPPLPMGSKKRKPNANGPRRTSKVWLDFNILPDEPIPTAACKHCHQRYLCHSKTHGTSNMKAHSEKCKSNPAHILNDPTQTNLSFGDGGSLVPSSQRFNAQACRNAIVLFVILDEHSFRVVEGEGFKQLCRQLQPQMTIPSRRTIARDCFQVYLAEKLKLKALFKSDCSRVALTTDCWTSVQNLGYMTLTAHFIDKEWNYQKRIISFSLVPNHKGDTIGRKIEEVLMEWGLKNVSTITVDNASSNDVAVSYLNKRLKNKNGLMGEGDYFHMRCCAHILNLVVQDGLTEQDLSIRSIRNAVRFVRSSPQRALKFKECIDICNITCKKLLSLDVSTRWNSTYMMLEAAEKYQAAFDKLEGEDSGYLTWFGVAGPPTSDDWERVRAFVGFLKIFFEATKVFSSSQQVSLHTAFHNLASIQCELDKTSMNLNTIVAVMGSYMKGKYDKYWGDIDKINHFLYFGVICDPRYKLRYIQWTFDNMYGEDVGKVKTENVKDSLMKLYTWYKSSHDRSVVSVAVRSVEQSAPPKNPSFFARVDAFRQHLKEKDSIDKQNELERYLSDACSVDCEKFDILIWWKQNSTRYPILAAMVREILATPVSTVASESAFSTGGRVLDTYRSSLSPKMAEALICTQNWLKPSFSYFKDLILTEDFEISENVVTELQQCSITSGGRQESIIGGAAAPGPA